MYSNHVFVFCKSSDDMLSSTANLMRQPYTTHWYCCRKVYCAASDPMFTTRRLLAPTITCILIPLVHQRSGTLTGPPLSGGMEDTLTRLPHKVTLKIYLSKSGDSRLDWVATYRDPYELKHKTHPRQRKLAGLLTIAAMYKQREMPSRVESEPSKTRVRTSLSSGSLRHPSIGKGKTRERPSRYDEPSSLSNRFSSST